MRVPKNDCCVLVREMIAVYVDESNIIQHYTNSHSTQPTATFVTVLGGMLIAAPAGECGLLLQADYNLSA